MIKSRVYYLTAASKYEAGVMTPSRLVMWWPKNSWTKHDQRCYHQPQNKSYPPASVQHCATELITVETPVFQISVAACVFTPVTCERSTTHWMFVQCHSYHHYNSVPWICLCFCQFKLQGGPRGCDTTVWNVWFMPSVRGKQTNHLRYWFLIVSSQ